MQITLTSEQVSHLMKIVDEPEKRPRPRVINKMAKNLTAGDIVEFPGNAARLPVNGWSRRDGHVTVSAANQRLATFREDERVRVYREVRK
jgi:hypothetical protein